MVWSVCLSETSTMNNLHPKLKFEIEKPEITPSGHSLSLLDFKVTISKNGKSSFEFYKKTAKKPIFVHHQSAMPKKSKINFIRNERKRIEDNCSTKTIAGSIKILLTTSSVLMGITNALYKLSTLRTTRKTLDLSTPDGRT